MRAQALVGDFDGQRVVGRLVGFLRFLRGHGFKLGTAETIDAARLLVSLDLLDASDLRWSLRSLVCGSADEWRRFDDLFDAYWLPAAKGRARLPVDYGGGESTESRREPAGRPRATSAMALGRGEGAEADGLGRQGGASRVEALGDCDFRHLADPELVRQTQAAVARIAGSIRWLPSRREQLARRGRWLDLGDTLARSIRWGGWPFEPSLRNRRMKPPRLVVLLDASGSMSLYSMILLRFVRGLVRAFPRSEAFVFHTRLVRVTDALRTPGDAEMTRALADLSQGWSGGTRIGSCLKAFNDGMGRRMSRTRTVAIVISDGLDTGAPEELALEVRRLRERARKLVWLNPLLGRAGYRPVAAGMAAALPFADIFAPAYNLTSLAALKQQFAHL